MKNAHTVAAALLCMSAVFAAGASAAPMDVKLGLWQSTITSEVSGMPPIDMSRYTPEQRARMEAAFKKYEARGPRTTTYKTCLTKKNLRRIRSRSRARRRNVHDQDDVAVEDHVAGLAGLHRESRQAGIFRQDHRAIARACRGHDAGEDERRRPHHDESRQVCEQVAGSDCGNVKYAAVSAAGGGGGGRRRGGWSGRGVVVAPGEGEVGEGKALHLVHALGGLPLAGVVSGGPVPTHAALAPAQARSALNRSGTTPRKAQRSAAPATARA